MRVNYIILFLLVGFLSVGEVFAEQAVNNRIEINDDNIPANIESGDLFGYQIESIGNLDGLGADDLAVIKFSTDYTGASPETNVGSILILFMNSDGSVASTNEIVIDGTAAGLNGCIANDSTNRIAGSLEQLAFVGDLDGDGKPTLALGAPRNEHNGIIRSGAVYMLELNSDGTVDNCLRIIPGENGFAPDNSNYLESFDSFFGWPLIATDLNGDGQNELIVGASDESNHTTNLWVFFLTSTGAVSSHPATPILGITDIGITEGIADRDYINDGDTIDGGTKIVIGVETGDDTPGNTIGDEVGAIHIINLTSDGAFSSSTQILGISLGQGISGDSESFGSAVAALGDMDNDGVDDIMVGNVSGDDNNTNSGEVYILFMNSDDTVKESQKISNESEIGGSVSTFLEDDDLFGHGIALWRNDGANAVIAISAHQGDKTGAIYLFYIDRILPTVSKNGGCDDCTPPTFGVNKNGRLLVSNGFIFNGNSNDVTDFHTEFPLITVVTNDTNTVTVKMYENRGVDNIQLVQFGMGMPEIGSPLNDAQTLIEVWLDKTLVDEIVKIDKNNLVDIINATTSVVECGYISTIDCVELSLYYIYRDQPKYNIMAINAMDNSRNAQTNYLNDGILVIGDTLNEPPVQDFAVTKAGALYPQKAGLGVLTLSDYKTDVWTDEFGYNWSTNEYGPYLLDTLPVPESIPDKYSKWTGFNDRWHSGFESYKELQNAKAILTMADIYPN